MMAPPPRRNDRRLSQGLRALVLLGAPLAGSPAMAAGPLPQFLDCPITVHVDWTAEDIRIVPPREERNATVTLHLNTQSGEWVLSNAMSAALTVDGGTFDIPQDGTAYRTHWTGVGEAGRTHLHIADKGGRYPFVLLDRDGALQMGACVVPTEVFPLLR